jgi:uncharacterized protein HemY
MDASFKIRFLPGASRGPETPAQRDARLGRIHLAKGEWRRSVAYLRAAIAFEPHNTRHWLELGQALAGLGECASARDAWQAGLAWSRHAGERELGNQLQALLDARWQPAC